MRTVASLEQRQRPAASSGKDHLLEITSKVIAERGFDKARFADVAREAGVAISTLQYSFGAREDLLVQALQHTHGKELAVLRDQIGSAGDPLARLHAYIEHAFKGAPSDHVAWLIWLESLRGATKVERLRKLALDAQEGWVSALRDIVRQGVDERVFAEVDVNDAADQVFAMINGLGLADVIRGRKKLDAAMRRAQDGAQRLLMP